MIFPPISGELFHAGRARRKAWAYLTAKKLADVIEVPPNRLYQVLAGKRSITADTALRLGQYFGMSADFWMNLQTAYELDLARQQLGKAIHRLPTRSGAPSGVRQQSR
jgi:addiction module HigA family antidote